MRAYSDRNDRIAATFVSGVVLAAIASRFGISKMRVSQILRSRGLSRCDGGASARARARRMREKVKTSGPNALTL